MNIKCRSNGEVRWNFSQGAIPNNVIMSNNTLYIYGVFQLNEGIYECTGYSSKRYSWSDEPVRFYSRTNLIYKGKNILY